MAHAVDFLHRVGDFGCTLAVLSTAIGPNALFEGLAGSTTGLILFDNDRSWTIADYLSGDSKSTVGNHMRVQVPPSAPKNSQQILDFWAKMTLAPRATCLSLTLAVLEKSL
ncbi:MAG TPA: hypothetical protein VMT61_07480 [Candidatus Binataceae bacterium]|nr:hypothetical protein [Candidatus Binataceae bacterium]